MGKPKEWNRLYFEQQYFD